MPHSPTANETRQLRARVLELEEDNRRLRARSAWAVMRLRACAEQVLQSLCEFEQELLVAPASAAS